MLKFFRGLKKPNLSTLQESLLSTGRWLLSSATPQQSLRKGPVNSLQTGVTVQMNHHLDVDGLRLPNSRVYLCLHKRSSKATVKQARTVASIGFTWSGLPKGTWESTTFKNPVYRKLQSSSNYG